MTSSDRSVVIVQRRLTHYRTPLFEAMRESLAGRGLQLRLLVGRGTAEEEKKRDAGSLSWAEPISTTYLAGGRLCWQPFFRQIGRSALVVVTQENKLLQNHLLMLAPRRFKLAFWGHGANLQSAHPDGVKERFKRWTTNRVDWWFAYTQMSYDLLRECRFPDERVTVLNNAVDTSALLRELQSIDIAELSSLRESLDFGKGPVGVFVGSLYSEKRLEFLFEAAARIRAALPDFHLLLVGDGPERSKVQAWCASHPWTKWVGARLGGEKVRHIALGEVMLNPGLVGLGILDAFVCGVPMFTTDCRLHSPEISYLQNGVNGVMTRDDVDAYAESVVQVLTSSQLRERLRKGCSASARDYTVENMAHNFADGIVRCLDTPRYRTRVAA